MSENIWQAFERILKEHPEFDGGSPVVVMTPSELEALKLEYWKGGQESEGSGPCFDEYEKRRGEGG